LTELKETSDIGDDAMAEASLHATSVPRAMPLKPRPAESGMPAAVQHREAQLAKGETSTLGELREDMGWTGEASFDDSEAQSILMVPGSSKGKEALAKRKTTKHATKNSLNRKESQKPIGVPSLPVGEAAQPAKQEASPASASPLLPADTSKRNSIFVSYAAGDCPETDLLSMRGGQGLAVVITMIAPGGKAENAGVKAGFKVLSFNGSQEFRALAANEIKELLVAPLTVEFEQPPASANSPRCKEIRLVTKKPEDKLGMAPRTNPWSSEDRVEILDEVVFQPGHASAWLKAEVNEGSVFGHLGAVPEDDVIEDHRQPKLVELRPIEAHRVLGTALAKMSPRWGVQVASKKGRSQGSRDFGAAALCGCIPELDGDTLLATGARLACASLPDCKLTFCDSSQSSWV